MHLLLLLISVSLVVAAAVVAPPEAAETAKPSASTKAAEIRKMSDAYFKQCMQDWDATTHMTQKEWQRTCRRIADERAKFRVESK